MANEHGIKKETYVDADPKTQAALTFDMLDNISNSVNTLDQKFETQVCACTERIDNIDKKVDLIDKKVDKRKISDKAFAGGTGVIGGFIANLFK